MIISFTSFSENSSEGKKKKGDNRIFGYSSDISAHLHALLSSKIPAGYAKKQHSAGSASAVGAKEIHT